MKVSIFIAILLRKVLLNVIVGGLISSHEFEIEIGCVLQQLGCLVDQGYFKWALLSFWGWEN